MNKEFIKYEQSLALKELGFDEPCFGYYNNATFDTFEYYDSENTNSKLQSDYGGKKECTAPLYQQAINFLYICSNKQINIDLKGNDTYEERIRKIEQGCKDLWNLQNNKSNQ